MEDDTDWDVASRSQLRDLAIGSQLLANTPRGHIPYSLCGDDWDLLWLGHCGNQPVSGDKRRVVIENDPSVTPFIQCDHEDRGFECTSVFSQIVDTNRAAVSSSKDSDNAGVGDQLRNKGMAFTIAHSTKLNIPKLVDGNMNEIESQWPGEVPEVTGPTKISLREKLD